MNKTLKSQKGFTLVEAMLAITIIAIVSLAMINVQSFMSTQSVAIKNRAYATQKAIQMMEELRALVAGAELENVSVLDNYHDGAIYNPVLTTNKAVTDPGNPLSGNVSVAGNWKYLRNVTVAPDESDPYTRNVKVDVCRNDPANPGQPKETLAEISAVLRTVVTSLVPSQVLDVYVLDIENVPGWWTNLSTMSPIFDTVLQNVQLLNPGLTLRTTWINRMAYGRDQEYYPYINEFVNTNSTGMPYVYFYPGKMNDDNGNPYDFYISDFIKGQENIDGTPTHAGTYALADTYNHCVRYPDEVAIYNQNNTDGTLQPSLRMLLEQMNTNPTAYKNAIFVNLHGELLPMPPMRNYSDAAKAPAMFPYKRLVTHPENLKYASTDPVKLRVYPYTTNISSTGVKGTYYNWNGGSLPSKDTLTPVSGSGYTRYDRKINFNWGGSPAPGINANKFVVKWAGYVTPEYSEPYTFVACVQDGVELYINDPTYSAPVMDHWPPNGTTSLATPTSYFYTMNLTANSTYYIEMHYASVTNTFAKLSWYSTTLSTEPVPFDTIPLATVYSTDTHINISNISVVEIVGGPDAAYKRVNVDISKSTAVCTVSYPLQGGTLITLLDTPVFNSTNSATGFGGLRSTWTLYGLEYIPCPVASDFSNDLVTSSNTKNTARWIITFAPNTFTAGVHPFETRIGSDLTTGTLQNQPPNCSRTYIWVNQSPPFTEQFQYMGDPRHCPYLDVKNYDGYNWYFAIVPDDPAGYQGFDKTNLVNALGTANGNGWSGYNPWGNSAAGGSGPCDGTPSHTRYMACDFDVPRFFLTYRNALLSTESLWTTMCGWSYYYVGMGGEMGMNNPPLAGGLPFLNLPWSKSGNNSSVKIDEIYGGHQRIIASTDDTWFAKNWIGELYQDEDYPTWQNAGNMPTGVGNYWRAEHNSDFAKYFTFDRSICTAQNGCASFYNGSSGGGAIFDTDGPNSANGYLTALGNDMMAVFGESFEDPMPSNRPFSITSGAGGGATGNEPPEWTDPIYSDPGIRTVLSIPAVSGVPRTYYTSDDGTRIASAMIQMVLGSSACFVSANGLSNQGTVGTIETGGFIIVNMIRCFLDAGLYNRVTGKPPHIPQLPYLQITNPLPTTVFGSGTASIKIDWTYQWLRWDGKPYTSEYASLSPAYSETTPLVYNVKYSDGNYWYFCDDGSSAQEGVYDPGHSLAGTTYTWLNLSGLSKGVDYTICVEAYRQGYNLHYSYDQVQFHINN